MVNLSGWYRGRIGLENKVIDTYEMEIRPRITKQDLEKYYSECMRNLDALDIYFEDKNAFNKTKTDLLRLKKPSLIAREAVYPELFKFDHSKNFLINLISDSSHENEKYFYVPGCTVDRIFPDSPFLKIIYDSKEEIDKVLKNYKPKKVYIELPNDVTPAKSKSSMAHEILHQVVNNYQINSKKLITEKYAKAFLKFERAKADIISKATENISEKDKNALARTVAYKKMEEITVEILTPALLEHDKEALFENKWLHYSIQNTNSIAKVDMLSASATGLLMGFGVGFPILWAFLPVPPILRKLIHKKYKKSKFEELTKPVKIENFKI